MSQVYVLRIYIICLVLGMKRWFRNVDNSIVESGSCWSIIWVHKKIQMIHRCCKVISSTYWADSLFSLSFLKTEPWPNPLNWKVRGSKTKSERRNNIWLVGKQSTWSWSVWQIPQVFGSMEVEEKWYWTHRAKFPLLHFRQLSLFCWWLTVINR